MDAPAILLAQSLAPMILEAFYYPYTFRSSVYVNLA